MMAKQRPPAITNMWRLPFRGRPIPRYSIEKEIEMTSKSLAALVMGAFLLAACGGGGSDSSDAGGADSTKLDSSTPDKKDDGKKDDGKKDDGKKDDGKKEECDARCQTQKEVAKTVRMVVGEGETVEIAGKPYAKQGDLYLRKEVGDKNIHKILDISRTSDGTTYKGYIVVGEYSSVWNVGGVHDGVIYHTLPKNMMVGAGKVRYHGHAFASDFDSNWLIKGKFDLEVDLDTENYRGKISYLRYTIPEGSTLDDSMKKSYLYQMTNDIDFDGKKIVKDDSGCRIEGSKTITEDSPGYDYTIYFAGPQATEVAGQIIFTNETAYSLYGHRPPTSLIPKKPTE